MESQSLGGGEGRTRPIKAADLINGYCIRLEKIAGRRLFPSF